MAEKQAFYIGVKGIIRTEGGVFIVKDTAGKGKWEVPGGRIDKGQSIEGAFKRELDEEVPGAQLHSLGETVHEAIGDFEVEDGLKLFLVFKLADVVLPEHVVLSDEHESHAVVSPETLDSFDLYSSDREAISKVLDIS